MAAKLTAIIADEHSVMRLGIRILMERLKIKVLGEVTNGRDAVALAVKHHPTLVTLDVPLPLMNGIEAARQIMEAGRSRVLLVTNQIDDYTIDRAMLNRVHGFVIKESPVEVVQEALKVVSCGGQYFEQRIREHVARYAHMPGHQRHRDPSPLTPREREVLQLVAEGHTNKQVADFFKTSRRTVESQCQSIMRKLGVFDRAGLTRYAVASGLTTLRRKL